ncbi:MAG: S24 family peptidase [Gammaproteobacteria bacterium]
MKPTFGDGGGCAQLEPYALQVTDESMAPEFPAGCVIVVEPALFAEDGQYIVADYAGDTWFRQYSVHDDGSKYLKALNDEFAEMQIIGPFQVRGVIIGRNIRGKRKKYY